MINYDTVTEREIFHAAIDSGNFGGYVTAAYRTVLERLEESLDIESKSESAILFNHYNQLRLDLAVMLADYYVLVRYQDL